VILRQRQRSATPPDASAELGAIFQAQIAKTAFEAIVSSAALVSVPELPPWMRSAAATHPLRSASILHLFPISIIRTSQIADCSCRSMQTYPYAMPTSTFYMPDLLHSIFCRVPVCSANTKWSPIIYARSPQSPGSDVSAYTACHILPANLDWNGPPAMKLPPRPSAIPSAQIS
jgi:hypothetical protein